jgi:hypothetical protein
MNKDTIAIQLSISFLIYVFLGAIGLVLFLSEPSETAVWFYFSIVGLVTAGVLKITNFLGLVPGLSKWVDRHAEGFLYGLFALGTLVMLFNGYLPVQTVDFIKLW